MEQHLLAIHIGPVQDFIAQARRTRDLRAGSQLLCELSRAAAKAVRDSGGEMIVPHPDHLEDADVANRILVQTADPKAAVARARADIAAVLQKKKGQLLDNKLAAQVLDQDVQPRIDEQLGSLVEFFAASVQLTDKTFAAARRDVMALLNARKKLREFQPWTAAEGRKSSLDGARASILRPPPQRPPLTGRTPDGPWATFGIGKGEELDAVGLLKRLEGWDDDQRTFRFTPVPTVAAVPWLRRVLREDRPALQRLSQACAALGLRRSKPIIADFPYDAQLLFDYRWNHYLGDEAGKASAEARQFGVENIQSLLDRFGAPGEHLACLVADGDDMGRLIDQCDTAPAERDLAERLATFAREARRIIERYDGMLVYAGGDDVLAFINLADAPACAEELAAVFAATVHVNGHGGTLSVGLGVGHCMEALGDLLEFGRDAEKLAKHSGKNGLAIQVQKRSAGQMLQWFSGWDQRPAERLTKDGELLKREQVSKKKLHEILAVRERFQGAAGDTVFAQEARRILQRSNRGRGAAALDLAALGLSEAPDAKALEELCNRLLIVTEIVAVGDKKEAA